MSQKQEIQNTKKVRIQELRNEQIILARKAIRIMKYYPKPKRSSTKLNRMLRVLMIALRIASIQCEKRIVASQPYPHRGKPFGTVWEQNNEN